MKILRKKLEIFLSLLVSTAVLNYPSAASELRDGTIFFQSSPRLLEAYSTFSDARVWGAKYYFTLHLPENAGEPLEKLVIEQRQGFEKIDFQSEETFAFVGDPNAKQAEIPLTEVAENEATREISLTFASPILPGTTFSVALKPRRNPRYGGVYIFGVTAYPAGEQSRGTYLGIARFHFYDDRDSIR